MRLSKRENKIQEEKIEHLSTALKETRTLLYEKNTHDHITHLQKTIQLEQTIEILNIELTDVSKQIEQDLEKYEEEITELEAQICHLQEKCQTEVISTTASSQKHEFTANVRALYYSLLSIRVPPRQIKSVVKNVISNLVPSVNVDELCLRGNLVLLICVVMKCLQSVMFIKLLC